jgi:hypothetical protein
VWVQQVQQVQQVNFSLSARDTHWLFHGLIRHELNSRLWCRVQISALLTESNEKNVFGFTAQNLFFFIMLKSFNSFLVLRI